jgi:hypothetical protein
MIMLILGGVFVHPPVITTTEKLFYFFQNSHKTSCYSHLNNKHFSGHDEKETGGYSQGEGGDFPSENLNEVLSH